MIEDLYPATPMQQGMLFHTLLAPRSGAHINQLNLLFRGRFDPGAFEAAWRQVIARHTALRTGFVGFDRKEPLQVVHTEAEVPLQILDWRGLSENGREERLTAFLEEDLRRDFDLEQPPLMRLTLIREEDAAYRFLLTHHHAILDGWSQPILLREFLACYREALDGRQAVLGPIVPFRDYIAWLVRQESETTEAYWRRSLAGFTEPTPIGTPIGGEPGVAADGEAPLHLVLSTFLTAGSSEALRAYAREHQVTVNTLMQGAWALLLRRLSGRSDVVFGVVSSGRSAPVPGIEEMVGLFINTLPARVRLRDEVRPSQWLREIQEAQAEMRQYEHSSLVEVQSWSEVKAGLPLFESIIAFESFPVDESVEKESGETLGISAVAAFDQSVYPLGLTVIPGPRLSLTLKCDPRRFPAAAMQRLMVQIESILEDLLLHGERPLGSLPLLTAAERHQVLVEWNDTLRPLFYEACLPERIASWGEEQGDAVALASGTWQLTYGELASRTRRWGAWLRGFGIGRESVVGLSLGRSPVLIETLLGVWQAEAMFVVLDPALPLERRRWVVEDAGVGLMLTDEANWEAWNCPTFTVEEINLAPDPGPVPNGVRLPDTGAYTIYTSGSTGRPKGVLVPHAGLRDLVENQRELLAAGPGSRVLQWASWSFDAAVADLTMAFGTGGTLVLGTDRPLVGPELAELLSREEISHCTVTPSALSSVPAAALPALSVLIVAGEALSEDLAGRWAGGRRLMNHYGPTEATVWATAQRITDAGRPPVGRPVGNARAYVMDRTGMPAPLGTEGELWLGGEGIARGYLARPEMTAERFVPDPFGGPGGRLYRTGDLVRFLPDGALDFLGRIDTQVKVRGFRVELGEIEAALASHSRIAAAVVVAQTQASGDKRLVAFVVPRERSADLVSELRASLEQTLPEPMIPAHFVLLDQLPLTTSGKVDRKQLEAWEPDRDGAVRGSAASSGAQPRTPVEELVAGVFAEVLQRDRVGIEEDFFDIGGHSLLGIQVVSRIEGLFGIELPLGALFDNPTVALLSSRIEELQTLNRGTPPPIVPVPRDQELPLSFAQERLWFLDQLDPGTGTYHLPMAVSLRGELDRGSLRWSLSELVRRHEVLRTRYVYREGRPVQSIVDDSEVAVPLVDLRGLGQEVRTEVVTRFLRQEKRRPFELAREHPLRAGLLRLEDDHYIVWLTTHHIASDGWSLGIVGRELSALYGAKIRGEAPALPELDIQYADFAVWQRGWLTGEELERQLQFWRESLSGAPPLLDLPLDRPRPPAPRFRGARVPFRLPRELKEELVSLSRAQGATMFMLLLAGLTALLSRIAQEDVVVGTVVANRRRREIEDLIGFFVNTLALRMKAFGDPAMTDLIVQAREVALGSYANQDLPFEKVVETLAPQRSRAHSPLFQILFVLQNAPEAGLELPGVKPERLPGDREGVARFDLTLTAAVEAGGVFGSWEYNRDLFDAATVLRITDHLRTLLAGAVRQPGCRLSDLPLLSDGQRHQVLVDWDDRARTDRPAPGVLEAIASHVRQRPDAVAAVHRGEHLTYLQLEERADRLAYRLREEGVGPEICVGICMAPSMDLLIGMLGILQAGGAYLPLDPSYPVERLIFMLEDALASSAVRLVLVQEGSVHEALVSRLPGLRAVRLEADAGGATLRGGAAAPEAAPESMAYVIYTSGSTGTPKGVAVTHGGLANLVAAQRRLFDVEPGSRVLQFSSPSFDAAVSEIMVTLASGACLCLADRQATMPGPDLAGVLNEQEITVVTLPPSALAALPEGPYPALRTLVAAGEACPSDLAWRWAHGRRMINAYGPTEMTVCASADLLQDGEGVSIGRPIDNTQLYVMAPQMNPVPIGVAGELCLSGPGLARGYHGRSEATAVAFVPAPFAARAGDRLYRTGDRVRRLRDGRIEFLGRLDRQTKLRGFRIEPGEVEATLARHPELREAAVIVREGPGGDRRLAAYVVPRDGEISPEELRTFLRGLLPDYMIPSHFVALERLPLLTNGKVDLRSLARERGGREERPESAAPRNPWEAALAEIFAQVLGLESVGVNDEFFELGGHSLLAVGLAARIEKRFGRKVPLATIFEGPTVEQLTRRLFDPARYDSWSPLVAMRPEGAKPPFFCVHPLGGGVTGYYHHLVRHLGSEQPFYGLQARGLEELAGLHHPSIEEMASEYIDALRAVQPHGPYHLGGSSYGGMIAFEMAQQLVQQGEQIAVLAMIDARVRSLEVAGPPTEEDEELPEDSILAYSMARSIATLAERELRLGFDELKDQPLEKMLTLLLERMREAGLADEAVDIPWLLRYREGLKARLIAGARYRALPYEGRVDLFRTTRSAPEEPPVQEEELGWRAIARGGVELHWVSGSHQTMLLEPYVKHVAVKLTACLGGGRGDVSFPFSQEQPATKPEVNPEAMLEITSSSTYKEGVGGSRERRRR